MMLVHRFDRRRGFARTIFAASTALMVSVGCGDLQSTPPNISTASGSGGQGGAPDADAHGGVTSSSTSITAGSGGLAGNAGSGGTAAGFGGSAGGDGAAPDASALSDADASATTGDGAPSCGATQGTQADPGTVGDGTAPFAAPYNTPPEALMHLGGAPTGTLTGPLMYESKVNYVGLKYQYWIYVPKQYKPGCRAALMVFQDAIHYVGLPNDGAKFNTPTVFDNLIHAGDMPVTIGLFVNPGEPNGIYDGVEGPNRSRQYDQANDTYSKFLINELLPDVLLKQYDIVDDPDGWGIGGHSSGGIAAFMVGWYRPDKFRKLLTHSASFPNTGGTFPNAITQVTPAKPLRVYLLSGPNDLTPDWYTQNTQAAMDLMAKGYHYRYRTETGGHFPPVAGVADFPDALRWMWRNYKLP